MKNHIRVDTIKVFKNDLKIINQIMLDLKIEEKSSAWREALIQYEKNKESNQKIGQLSNEVKILSEKIDSLYFIMQTLVGEKGNV